MLKNSTQSGVGGQPLRRSNSLKKMVMSASNMRWKASRKLVSSAAVQEQIFNLGISKETNLELARDLCREAKQELYKKCRSESARNRSCSARSSSCSTQTKAFASVRHRYFALTFWRLKASTVPSVVPGMPWKWRTPAWWGKNNFKEITFPWNKIVTLIWTCHGLVLISHQSKAERTSFIRPLISTFCSWNFWYIQASWKAVVWADNGWYTSSENHSSSFFQTMKPLATWALLLSRAMFS